jgi:hypothetical protein
MKVETCSVCGEQVRWGMRDDPNAPTRPGSGFWMHRDRATDVDHRPKFGHLMTPEEWAAIDAAMDEHRVRDDGSVYTTRNWKVKGKADAADGADTEAAAELKIIPEPEVLATPIDRTDERFPGGCKTIANLVDKQPGGRWIATYSRGPRVHASHGTLLGMSDYVVLRLAVDHDQRRAVGFWVDTKFDHAWLATVDLEHEKYLMDPGGAANSDALKAWIKGE